MIVRFGYSVRVNLHDVPRVITMGFLPLSLPLIRALWSQSFGEFLGAVALSGVSSALIMPHSLSLMGPLSPEADRERNLRSYSLTLSLHLVVAPILGIVILTHVALKRLYALLLAFSMIGLGLMVGNAQKFRHRLRADNDKHDPLELVAANTIAQSSFDLSATLAPLAFMLVMGQGHLG